jgi:hypothetical protein
MRFPIVAFFIWFRGCPCFGILRARLVRLFSRLKLPFNGAEIVLAGISETVVENFNNPPVKFRRTSGLGPDGPGCWNESPLLDHCRFARRTGYGV